MKSLKEVFEQRKSTWTHKAGEKKEQASTVSYLRIIIFILGVIGVVYFANQGEGFLVTLTALVSGVIFSVLLSKHTILRQQESEFQILADINEDEGKRIDHQLSHLQNGAEYLDEKHAYAYDLDVFGRNSLFHLINRSQGPSGKDMLASWLKEPATKEEILARQQAVQELTPLIDWRQQFQMRGTGTKPEDGVFDSLKIWLEGKNVLNSSIFYRLSALVLPFIFFGFIVAYYLDALSLPWLGLPLLVNGGILVSILTYARKNHQHTTGAVQLLEAFERQIQSMEQSTFQASFLNKQKAAICTDGKPASHIIRKLRKLLYLFNARANQFYAIFNAIFLIDLFLLLMAERIKSVLIDKIDQWHNAIGVMEAINSMAGFAYAHPEYVYPDINSAAGFSARALGHPLIKPGDCVTNDFKLEGAGKLAIVTGSNMAGKSTFLRTVGVNVVLGQMGAVVYAKECSLSLMRVFSSMRTKDNLEESISSFYAELLRIRQLLESIRDAGAPTLFLLDEILKGTNSHDRHEGAAALITKLQNMNAFGLVSTHDVELSELEGDNVSNYHFDSQVNGDQINFDYLLKSGKCVSFNASALMKKMGILG